MPLPAVLNSLHVDGVSKVQLNRTPGQSLLVVALTVTTLVQ